MFLYIFFRLWLGIHAFGLLPLDTPCLSVWGWAAQQRAVGFGEDNQSYMENPEQLRIGRQ